MVIQQGSRRCNQQQSACGIRGCTGSAGVGKLAVWRVDEGSGFDCSVRNRTGDNVALIPIDGSVVAFPSQFRHPVEGACGDTADGGGLILMQGDGAAAFDRAKGSVIFAVAEGLV